MHTTILVILAIVALAAIALVIWADQEIKKIDKENRDS
jgi:hypothetical protein